MPTAAGRETTAERETRQRVERFAAIRAAITPEIVAEMAYASTDTMFPAGWELTLRAGHRSIKVDEGEIRQLALADALEARGHDVIGHSMSFGLYAGRGTRRYGVTVAS